MPYKIKRGSAAAGFSLKEALASLLKRLMVFLVVTGLIAAAGYFLFRFAYTAFPPFAEAADDVGVFLKGFYQKHGVWATIGLIGFVFVAVWAFGEEARRKDRRREAVKEMMK